MFPGALQILTATLLSAAPPAVPAEAQPSAAAGSAEPRGTTVAKEGDGAVPVSAPAAREGRSWFALPAVFWLPETQLGFAGAAGLHFRVGESTAPSDAFLVAGYALGGQASVDVSTDLWLASGALAAGRVRAVHYPDAFYGIGSDTVLSQREDMTRRYLDASGSYELPIPGTRGLLRAGPRLEARAEEIRGATPGGLVAAGAVTGSTGFSGLALGGEVVWDSRDEKLWPQRGSYVRALFVHFPSALGRNDGFGRSSLEAKAFLPLGAGRVLAIGGYTEAVHGATPFTVLARLGGSNYLRGIREGRYRDRIEWAVQAEARLPIAYRFSGVVFGAAGDVAPDASSIGKLAPKVGGGGGLRFNLTDAGATVRADVAIADAGPEVYVLLLEAF